MDTASDSTICARLRVLLAAAALASSVLATVPLHAAEARITVRAQGQGVGDAVVSLHSPAAAAAVRPGSAIIDQRNTQFTPRVSVITTGTPVRFPNSDNVRHQVYSFSPAKRFELPLYSGRAAPPVVFDKPGVVTLGCNIHDWMVAHVVVVDSPYYAMSDANGRVRIDAPAGRYTLRIWHPDLKGSEPVQQTLVLGDAGIDTSVDLVLVKRSDPQAPADDKLRALQERFRKLKERN